MAIIKTEDMVAGREYIAFFPSRVMEVEKYVKLWLSHEGVSLKSVCDSSIKRFNQVVFVIFECRSKDKILSCVHGLMYHVSGEGWCDWRRIS